MLSLVLTQAEICKLDQHLKVTPLHPNTPRDVVYFLSGCLPGEALIHLKMLSLFGIVARLCGYPLQIHGENILISGKSSSKSWFWLVRNLSSVQIAAHTFDSEHATKYERIYKNNKSQSCT